MRATREVDIMRTAPLVPTNPSDEEWPSITVRDSPRPVGRLLVGGTVLALVVIGLLVAGGLVRPSSRAPVPPGVNGPTGRDIPGLAVGGPAPDISASDLDGQPVQLSALRGHPVWINFWATWCPPCKTEMPRIEQAYQQYQAQGLIVLGVDLQEPPAAVRAWVQGRFHWQFVIDNGKLADLYDLQGVPSHVFIDRAGVVRGVQVGELSADQMAAQLAPILTP